MSTKSKTNSRSPRPKKAAKLPMFVAEPDEKPKHCIVGDEYVVQTDLGELRVSLRIRERTIVEMEGLPPREQFNVLLAAQNPAWVDKMPDLDATEAAIARELFYLAFAQWQGLRLGEALPSSD